MWEYSLKQRMAVSTRHPVQQLTDWFFFVTPLKALTTERQSSNFFFTTGTTLPRDLPVIHANFYGKTFYIFWVNKIHCKSIQSSQVVSIKVNTAYNFLSIYILLNFLTKVTSLTLLVTVIPSWVKTIVEVSILPSPWSILLSIVSSAESEKYWGTRN